MWTVKSAQATIVDWRSLDYISEKQHKSSGHNDTAASGCNLIGGPAKSSCLYFLQEAIIVHILLSVSPQHSFLTQHLIVVSYLFCVLACESFTTCWILSSLFIQCPSPALCVTVNKILNQDLTRKHLHFLNMTPLITSTKKHFTSVKPEVELL